jgi:tricorn protease
VTDFGGADVWDLAVARDGRSAVVVVTDSLHRIDLASPGAKPVRIAITAPEDEADREETLDASDDVTEAVLSPDGKVLAVVAYGEVFVRNVEDKHPTARVTSTIARERGVVWSPDGAKLYFAADAGGKESIFAATVTTTRTEIREAYEKATKPPEPAKPAPPKPEPPKVEPPKAEPPAAEPPKPEPPAPVPPAPAPEPKPDAPKPDPKDDDEKKGDDDEKPVAKKPAAKRTPADRWQDAVEFKVDLVVASASHDREPQPSPDGKSILFRRGLGDLVVVDLASKAERVLVRGWDAGIDFRWSPDSRHVAFHKDDANFNSDVWIVRADGSSPAVNISRHPANDMAPRWSADGKVLVFLSERTDREFDVWRVNLDAKLDTMTALEAAEYFKEAGAAAKKRKPLAVPKKAEPKPDAKPDTKADAKPAETPAPPAEPAPLDLADAWKRLRRVTTMRGSESSLEIAPSGEQIWFRGKDGAEEGLFAIGWDGKGQKKLAAAGSLQMVSLTGETLVLVNSGRAATLPAAGGAPKTIDVDARIKVDRGEFAEQKFREAARIVGEHFYHPTMKGLDWAALTERYVALARRTRTTEEFDAIAAYLVGELNGSHLGVSSRRRGAAGGEPNGRLGVSVERVVAVPGTQEASGFRVVSVVPYGPADRGPMKLLPGDVVTAVEGAPFKPEQTFESALAGRVGRETRLAVRREQGGTRIDVQVFLTPVAWGTEVQLRYDAWCDANEARVHELSKGRLGYLHIRAMDDSSLQDFERDLYAAAEGHEGLVLDVRNNGGGSTADLVLASLMVQPHAYTVPRGGDPEVTTGYPRDRLFIQRYVLPANLLCNEKSFSNAEILSHAFRTLKRGTLVGQRTYGGVISTGGTTLLDGTAVRIPFRGWYLPDGADMENNGAVPDLLVPQTPEAESRGDDEQLRAAVEDLLRRLPSR